MFPQLYSSEKLGVPIESIAKSPDAPCDKENLAHAELVSASRISKRPIYLVHLLTETMRVVRPFLFLGTTYVPAAQARKRGMPIPRNQHHAVQQNGSLLCLTAPSWKRLSSDLFSYTALSGNSPGIQRAARAAGNARRSGARLLSETSTPWLESAETTRRAWRSPVPAMAAASPRGSSPR